MNGTFCPHCGFQRQGDAGACPSCGYGQGDRRESPEAGHPPPLAVRVFTSEPSPDQTPTIAYAPVGGRPGPQHPDYLQVARRQRYTLFLILAWILTYVAMFISVSMSTKPVVGIPIVFVFMSILQMLMLFAALVFAIFLMVSLRIHWAGIVVASILLLLPFLNLLTVLLINGYATRKLKKAGVRVGLLGGNLDDARRVVSSDLCRVCGYSKIGNVSGICPECGTPLYVAQPVT